MIERLKNGLIYLLIAILVVPMALGGLSVGAEEKVFTVSLGSNPPTLDPGLAGDTTSGAIITSTLEGLLRFDEEGKEQPAMAESWEVSEDGKTYTFKLREDLVWSDGEPITAHDFEYGWKRVIDPTIPSQGADDYYLIKGAEAYKSGEGDVEDVMIEALDDHHLEVELVSPAPYFLSMLPTYYFYPVPKHIVEENENWTRDVETYVTNGPFKLEEYVEDAYLTLVRNENYWDKENVAVDKVQIEIIESSTTANNAFLAGDLDFLGRPFNNVSPDMFDVLESQDQLTFIATGDIYSYKVNTNHEYLSNVNLRKALAYAIDRQGLIDNILKADQLPAQGLVPVTAVGFEELHPYFEDAAYDEAKEHLDLALEELGLEDASELDLTLQINTDEMHTTIAQYIQAEWKEHLGIDISIENQEWQVHLDRLESVDFDLSRSGYTSKYPDATTMLNNYISADNPRNMTGWESDEYKEVMQEAAEELDADERIKLLHEAEAIFMEDMPQIPIYFYSEASAAQDYVKGIEVLPIGGAQLKYADVEQ